MNYCENCGNKIEDDEVYCKDCLQLLAQDYDDVVQQGVYHEKFDTEKKVKEKKGKTVIAFCIVSIVLGLIIKPITACWTAPMSILIIYKIIYRRKIGKIWRILSWVLISPIVGGLLIDYKDY